LLVFPLSALAMGLRPVSYGLYATFLTPVFVLVADVASDPQQQLSNAMLRAGNNVIGALIAIAASYLLWPRRQQVNLHQKLTQMILSNLDYLLAALHVADKLSPESGAQSPLQTQRRTTCVINNETGILLQRLVREQYIDQRQVHGARISVALSRRLAAAATHVWLHHAPADDAALLYWLKQVRQLFERALTESTAYPAILRQRPALPELARADAVETICLLVLAMYPELSAPTTPP